MKDNKLVKALGGKFEKRTDDLHVFVSCENKKWIIKESSRLGITMGLFIDRLLTQFRSEIESPD